MKKITFFTSMLILFISCKKDEPTDPSANNMVSATVILSSGDTVKISATGAKALMGCSFYGGGSFVDGITETNAVYMSYIYGTSSGCVTSPGTYPFTCQYRPDIISQTGEIYSNYGAAAPGSITYTVRNGNNAEGYFNAVCKSLTDSVFVSGTFKGYIP